MTDKRIIPLFYFKCCYHRVQEPIAIVVKDNERLIIHFKCWYCGKEIILESKKGLEIEDVVKPKDLNIFYVSKHRKEDTVGQVFI